MAIIPNLFGESAKKDMVVPNLFGEEKPKSLVVPNLFGKEQYKESSFLQEAFVKPVKTFYGGVLKAGANTADTLDFYSDKIAKTLNIPETKNSIFEWLRDNWDTVGTRLQKEGLSKGVAQKIYSGLGEAGWEVPKLMALGPEGLVISGAAEGGKTGGAKGAVVGGATGALFKGTLKGLGTLPAKAKYPTAFGVGAVTAPGDLEEKVAGGAILTGLSIGKSPSAREFKEAQLKSPLVKGYQRILPFETRERIYQNYVNRFQSIENVVQKARNLGADIISGENPALRARGYLGIGRKVQAVLEDKTYRITPEGQIEITGEGLKPILDSYDQRSPIKGRDAREKDLNDYLIARRTIEDLQRPKSEFTIEQIVTPEQVKKAQDTLDNLAKKYGVIPPEAPQQPPIKAKPPVSAPIPPELEPLAIEAKKYKTAEEFVKNNDLIFQGGKVGTIGAFWSTKIGEANAYAAQRGMIGGEIRIARFSDLPKEITQGLTKQEYQNKFGSQIGAGKHVELPSIGKLGADTTGLKGDFQLTDFYAQATKLSPTEGKAPAKPITTIPNLDQTATRLYDYQKRVLRTLVDSGNISQQQYDLILSKNPHYVPFDRVIEGIEPTGGTPISKRRFTGARSPIKKIKGSELEIHNPIESMIKNTYRIMDIAERNTVARGVAKLREVLPSDISPVKVKMQPIKVTEQEAGEAKTIFRPSQFKPKGNIIEYFENGKRKYIEVSDNLYQAMSGLNETSLGLMMKIMSKPAHWLRVGATITPEFMIRNPIRDQLTALIQTKMGFRPFIDSTGAIADVMGKSKNYYDWLRSGGAYAGFVELNRPQLKQALRELQKRPSLLKNLNIINKAQDLSQLFEQATRLAVYKRGVKKGLTPVEAGFESREATVDFARRGSQTKDVNAVIAFFNAGIQGTDKSIRTAMADPAGFTAKAIATITIPSLLLYLKNRNDPDYKELPRWQKDLFWITRIGETHVRIPKPFLYGQIFGSIPERFFEYLETEDKEAFNKLEKSLYDAVLPVSGDPATGILATGLKPIIENASNWSFFRERPIVPEGKERLLPQEQYTKYTTETAKMAGEILKYPPAKIENLLQGWFGGTGKYALEAGDMLIKGIRKSSGQKMEPERPTELADIPLIKGFVTRPVYGQSESIQQFYEDTNKINQAYATYMKLLKEGKKEEALKIKEQYKEWKYAPVLNLYSKRLSMYNQQIERIVKSEKPEQEKRKLINEIEKRRTELAQKANKLIKEKTKKSLVVPNLFD